MTNGIDNLKTNIIEAQSANAKTSNGTVNGTANKNFGKQQRSNTIIGTNTFNQNSNQNEGLVAVVIDGEHMFR